MYGIKAFSAVGGIIGKNYIISILNNALDCVVRALKHVISLFTQTPETWFQGKFWPIMTNINSAMQGIGLGLLVLFFAMGVMRTCSGLSDIKRPEHALKLFIRFAAAKCAVTYGLDIMLALFRIGQGVSGKVMHIIGADFNDIFLPFGDGALPAEIAEQIHQVKFPHDIPIWFVALIAMVVFAVMSFILIATVYGRFFKLTMYTALAPLPLSSFAAEHTQNIGKTFLKSFCAVCLQGVIILLAFLLSMTIMTSAEIVEGDPVTTVWNYVARIAFQIFVLVGTVKLSDQIIREMIGS